MQFEDAFLLEFAKHEEFRNAVMEFSLSSQFKAAALQKFGDIEQLGDALVQEFSESEEFNSKISASQHVINAALEQFEQSEDFRSAVVQNYFRLILMRG